MRRLDKAAWVFAIILATLFVYTHFFLPKKTKEIETIKLSKDELIKLDSLLDVRDKKIIDSLSVVIQSLRAQDNRLNDFNTKIRRQNEKLDKIYIDIHIERPDF